MLDIGAREGQHEMYRSEGLAARIGPPIIECLEWAPGMTPLRFRLSHRVWMGFVTCVATTIRSRLTEIAFGLL